MADPDPMRKILPLGRGYIYMVEVGFIGWGQIPVKWQYHPCGYINYAMAVNDSPNIWVYTVGYPKVHGSSEMKTRQNGLRYVHKETLYQI